MTTKSLIEYIRNEQLTNHSLLVLCNMNTTLLFMLFATSLTSCSHLKSLVQNTSTTKSTLVDIRTTAYTHCESDHLKYGRKTAIGTTLKSKKSIATDWSVFPVGTKLKINENVYEVDDYGSALVKPTDMIPTVDIYLTSRSQMNKWGVKHFTGVEVVEWGDYEKSAKLLKDRLRYSHCRVMYQRIQSKL